MDTLHNGDEGMPGTTVEGDAPCKCGSPHCSEEICMCKYTVGTVIQDMSTEDRNESKRNPGLQHHNKVNRQVMKQQLKELLIRSDMILQNSILLQSLSARLLQDSIRMRDLCVIAEEKESSPELKERTPQENESRARQIEGMPQESKV
jgi:hypothetical protein